MQDNLYIKSLVKQGMKSIFNISIKNPRTKMIFGNIFNFDKDEDQIIKESSADYKKPGVISSLLKTLSSYGMNYDKQIYANMKAVPADKVLQKKDDTLMQNLYSGMVSNYKVKSEEEKGFRDKTLQQKREVLRRMAVQPEIEDILDIMSNECIVYDDDEAYICKPFIDNAITQDLNEASLSELRTAVDTIFYKIYLLLNFKKDAWNIFRRWLIDGVLSYEIIYDDLTNPHSIIGIVAVDPATLTRVVDDNGTTYWIQYKDVIGRERKLLDAQIIYIKYEDSGTIERQSYLERLIRPFNIYRIIEQAQIIWTVTQSSFKTLFTIPVAGMNKAKGLQTLNAAMNRYKEDITFNGETGEIKVNGRTNMPFNKEFWMPENENGTPHIETLTDNGPMLNDSEQLRFFESKLYKQSKIPESRFDKENQAAWFGSDPTQTLRDEINYGRFVNRLRATFGELITKPLRIQLSLQLPDIKNDKRILDSIGLRYNGYNQFIELMENEIDMKRMEHIQMMKDTFTDIDAEGNEVPFFCTKFLVMRFLKMSAADLALNEKLKLEQMKDEKAQEDAEAELDAEKAAGGESEEEPEADEQTGIDAEMMGDVQPESPETLQA